MTDHLDEAATRAVDIADRLREAAVNGMTPLGWEACAHLTYMAGLLRGLEATSAYSPARSGERSGGPRGDLVSQNFEHEARKRAEAKAKQLDGLANQLEAELTASRKEYAESVRQHEKTANVMEQARAERDELMHAIRDASADNGRPADMRLQDVVNVARTIEKA